MKRLALTSLVLAVTFATRAFPEGSRYSDPKFQFS
jgi:hypothetical protein